MQESIRWQLLRRARDRLAAVISREPIDFKYLHFITYQELQFLRAGAAYMDIPQCVIVGFEQLNEVIQALLSNTPVTPLVDNVAVVEWNGSVGQPRLSISRDVIESLLSTNLPLTTLANAHGISRSTLCRRMREYGLSVRSSYSDIPDCVLDMKASMTAKFMMP